LKVQRRAGFVGIVMVALLAATGCAEKSDDPDGSNGTSQPTNGSTGDNGGPGSTDSGNGTAVSIDITFEGDSVDPNGRQIEVPVNEPITLAISADAPGELHVHTQPEQEIAYPAGESSHELTLDRPGVYEVESHDLEKIVVELEAS
jgi:hypothetical protein